MADARESAFREERSLRLASSVRGSGGGANMGRGIEQGALPCATPDARRRPELGAPWRMWPQRSVLGFATVRFGGLYQRILGHPFVFNQVRPRLLGGIDMSPLYDRLRGERHTILDVGCGTGDALRYLEDFDAYVGYDTDPVAVEYMRAEYGKRPRVRIEHGLVTSNE